MTVALVTGGSGYFGMLLAEHLRAGGDEVRVFDLRDASDRHRDIEFVAGDIRDAAAVRAAVDGVDVVYHNVAQVPLAKDPDELRSVNVDGTVRLLEACADARTAKVVHTSSSAVFGVPATNPVLPTTVPKPVEEYGHAKLAAEWACLAASSRIAPHVDVSIVRPRTILGHGRLGIFGILFDWIADGADPFVLGEGANRYQFVHADDLASACVQAGRRPGPAVFNIGTDRFGTMREALEHLCDHAGTGSTVRSLPIGATSTAMRLSARAGLTPFAPYHWLMYSKSLWFDITHATEALDWSPRWSTDEMMAQSYDWFVANRSRTNEAGASHHRRRARSTALDALKRATKVLGGRR
ncbi:NAD-dependent epimerase/dehydratase family protein [soil metagenome]